MAKIEKKPNQKTFNLPAEDLRAVKAATGKLDLGELTGTWVACDQDTRNLVRVVLRRRGIGLTVQVFGACTPTPCDWGQVEGIAYAESVSATLAIAFSAVYKFSFKDAIVTGRLDNGSLIVETYNRFTDGSGRSNYYSRGYFCKRRQVRKG